jgi:4-amino-4-deoxy-L-arabinose transferase-like glycosyltransferase
VVGRLVSVLYGTATILIIYLLSRRLFRDIRISVIAAWIFALGGLHVTQSHFFLADVPTLFWSLLAIYWLLLELERPSPGYFPYLFGASISLGFAFGLKMGFAVLPTLAIVTLIRPPRLVRTIYALVAFIAAFSVINLMSFGYYDLYNIYTERSNDPYIWRWWESARLYIIESPGLLGFPMLILSIAGVIALAARFLSPGLRSRAWKLGVVIILPLVIQSFLVLFVHKHFLRHLIPFIPWMVISAAWMIVVILKYFQSRKIHPAWVIAPLFLYLFLFVFDGERVFIQEPRNEAEKWLYANMPLGSSYAWRTHPGLPNFKFVDFPGNSDPDVIVIEMHHANHYLSGMGFKNSFPRDYRYIFEADSQDAVDREQALFKQNTEYRQVISISEGYFMPEYVWIDRLIGNRSRNYVTELVIFRKE